MQTRNGLMSKSFHSSKAWRKASKAYKTPLCFYCKKSGELQTDHVLPVSKYPMMRLWKMNYVLACQPCNLAKSNNLKLNLKTIKLLVIYGMIKLIIYLSLAFIIVIMARFLYLDITYNASTITNQMKYEAISLYDSLKNKDQP